MKKRFLKYSKISGLFPIEKLIKMRIIFSKCLSERNFILARGKYFWPILLLFTFSIKKAKIYNNQLKMVKEKSERLDLSSEED
jgi:hypothetical protein